MNTVLNLRGSNGSGKSSAVRSFIQYVGVAETLNHPRTRKTCGYRLNSGVVVIGRYETACGGCDTIHSFAEIADAVIRHSRNNSVLFEGFLWSGIFKSSHELAQRLQGQANVIFATMNTPLATCISRTARRRNAAGNHKPFDPTNLIAKHRSVIKAHVKLELAGWDTRLVCHQNPLASISQWLAGSSICPELSAPSKTTCSPGPHKFPPTFVNFHDVL
jgi:hypothetical protein